MEASLISERTKQALAMSKNKGGRPSLDNDIKDKVIEMYQEQRFTVKEIVTILKISRSSVYKVLNNNKNINS